MYYIVSINGAAEEHAIDTPCQGAFHGHSAHDQGPQCTGPPDLADVERATGYGMVTSTARITYSHSSHTVVATFSAASVLGRSRSLFSVIQNYS